MNELAYCHHGDQSWHTPLPTWLIDSCDLLAWLGLRTLSRDEVRGIGTVPIDAYLYPTPHILHLVSPGETARQHLLDICLADGMYSFVTVQVTATDSTVQWSDFATAPGFETPLVSQRFTFAKEAYARLLASISRTALADAQHYAPNHELRPLSETWAAAVPETTLRRRKGWQIAW
jgi:hypothetical protein